MVNTYKENRNYNSRRDYCGIYCKDGLFLTVAQNLKFQTAIDRSIDLFPYNCVNKLNYLNRDILIRFYLSISLLFLLVII